MPDVVSLDGFDPLAPREISGEDLERFHEESTKRIILNILKSYTGYYDVFFRDDSECP